MNKIKLIGLSCLFAATSVMNAQEDRSEIVMTKSELKEFLQTVAKARRDQLRRTQVVKDGVYLNELRAKEMERKNKDSRSMMMNDGSGISNGEVLRQLDRLNNRLDNILLQGNGGAFGGGKDNSTIIMPGSNGYMAGGVSGDDKLATEKKIWALEKEIEALKSNLVDNIDELDKEDLNVSEKFDEANLEEAKTPEARRSMLEQLLAKYKNFKKQVFFANDSDQLSPEDYQYIKDVTVVLKDHPELSVLLEGWASPVGTSEYNKQLSMRRSEAVCRALRDNGIAQERLVTSFKGEDHSVSEAQARRVDMSIILK